MRYSIKSSLPATKAPKVPKALPRVPIKMGTASPDNPKCSMQPRGRIEPASVDCTASAGQRSDHAEVGHIAGGEEECARSMSELRQRLFQRVMRALVAGDEMRGAAARAVFVRARLECGDYRRMVREAQIIVAAKREIACAVDDDLGALRTIDHGTRAVLMLRAQRSERGGEVFHRGMPKW